MENCMKILEIFLRNSTGIYRKLQDYPELMNDFDRACKIFQGSCKTWRAWTKNEQNLEKYQETLRFF